MIKDGAMLLNEGLLACEGCFIFDIVRSTWCVVPKSGYYAPRTTY